MSSDLNKFQYSFPEKLKESLEAFQSGLSQLKKQPQNKAALLGIFRVLHAIKNSAALFGFKEISYFASGIQNLIDQARLGKILIHEKTVDLLVDCYDHLAALVDGAALADQTLVQKSGYLLAKIGDTQAILVQQSLLAQTKTDSVRPPDRSSFLPKAGSATVRKQTSQSFWIQFVPKVTSLKQGLEPLAIINQIMHLGECQVRPVLANIPLANRLDPLNCYLSWDIVITTNFTKKAIQQLFEPAKNQAQVTIRLIGKSKKAPEGADWLTVEKATPGPSDPTTKSKLPTPLPENRTRSLINQSKINQSLLFSAKPINSSNAASLWVSIQKLNIVRGLVGDLATVSQKMTQIYNSRQTNTIPILNKALHDIITDLVRQTSQLGLIPIGVVFNNLSQVAQNLADKWRKVVKLQTDYNTINVDASIIDSLQTITIGLIQYLVERSIESGKTRLLRGKPAQASITVTSQVNAGQLIIQLGDDGTNINAATILRRATLKGLVAKSSPWKQDILTLLLLTNLSTGAKPLAATSWICNLWAVKKEIESLRGQISLESRLGKGTIFVVKMPLSTAKTNNLVVTIGGESYLVPQRMIEDCIDDIDDTAMPSDGLQYCGQTLPIVSLGQVVNSPQTIHGKQLQLLVLRSSPKRLGLLVDSIIGSRQTVVINLGKPYQDCWGIGGASIMNNGSVALVLDIMAILQRFGDASSVNDSTRSEADTL